MPALPESDSGPVSTPAKLTVAGRVATITLSRPESYNSLNREMVLCLERFGAAIETDPDIRVVVIRGAGKAFCAGGDINVFASTIDDPGPPVRDLLSHMHPFLCGLRRMPKLVLTSVHGVAAGAGLSLAFMGDLCIAARDTRFCPAYSQLAVSPDCGGTVGIVQSIGARRALHMFLAQSEFTAWQAEKLGLVTHIVSPLDLEAATANFAESLAQTESEVIAATKSLIYGSLRRSVSEQLAAEMEALIGCMQTEAFRRRVTQFVS